MLIKFEHKEMFYQHRKLPVGDDHTNLRPPGWGFSAGLEFLSHKIAIATETQQKTSNVILRAMLDDQRTPPPVTTSVQSHQDARGLNSWKRNSCTKNKTTIKTSMQKQPKNWAAKQISEMVTDKYVKIKSRSPKLHEKMSLSRHIERDNISEL